MVTHGGASGRAISFYSMPRPSPCSGALTTWCTIEVAALPTSIEEAAFQEAPGRLATRAPASADASAVIPPPEMQP